MNVTIGPDNAAFATLKTIMQAAGSPLCCGLSDLDTEVVQYPLISVRDDEGVLLGVGLVAPPPMFDIASPSHLIFCVTPESVTGYTIRKILSAALHLSPAGVIMSVRATRDVERDYCQRVGAVLVDEGLDPEVWSSYFLAMNAFVFSGEEKFDAPHSTHNTWAGIAASIKRPGS